MKSRLSEYITIKKGLVGTALGLLCFGLLFLFRSAYIGESTVIPKGYLAGIPLAIAFAAAGFIRLEVRNRRVSLALELCWSLASAAAAIFWAMASVEAIAIWRMPLFNLALNLLFFFGCAGIVYAATGKWRLSVNVVTVLQFLVAVVNCYVWQFRGRELLFSDLSAADTALMVADQYMPAGSLRMMLGLSLWMLVFFSQFSLPPADSRAGGKKRAAAVVAAAAMIALTVLGSGRLSIRTWGGTGSSVNGFFVNFIISIRQSVIRAPENYSPQLLESIENSYTPSLDDGQAEEYPNIIVIMNESFADLRVLGDDLRTNQPVMPFFDSLEENTVRGLALVSAYGGSTANSEFEFLTGLTMGFLPVGSTPYQQYISGNVCSLAWILNRCGYDSFATHPYHHNSWARSSTYPLLGFRESSFIDAYPREQLLRQWISDQEMYEYITHKLETEDCAQPRFIFGITVQNHGGYNYTGDNYTQTIELEGYSGEYPHAEQYLSILRESDRALQYLLTFLQSYEEDTVVLFFGDHYPSLDASLYSQIHGGPFDTMDDLMLQYQVPFAIWANYDIAEKTVECTSLNYLGRYLLEAAGIELPAYYRFLADVEAVIPAINAHGYYSREQKGFVPLQSAQGTEKEWLDRYAAVAYNTLFDPGSRSDLLFGQYLPDP